MRTRSQHPHVPSGRAACPAADPAGSHGAVAEDGVQIGTAGYREQMTVPTGVSFRNSRGQAFRMRERPPDGLCHIAGGLPVSVNQVGSSSASGTATATGSTTPLPARCVSGDHPDWTGPTGPVQVWHALASSSNPGTQSPQIACGPPAGLASRRAASHAGSEASRSGRFGGRRGNRSTRMVPTRGAAHEGSRSAHPAGPGSRRVRGCGA